jgi:DNA-binding HxlR family transcriptional regulator
MIALRQLGSRWTLVVLRSLIDRSRRFCEIRKETPQIPAKSLARVLSKLEREGLIRRLVSSTRPPQVSYSLTDDEPLLSEVIQALFRWGSKQSLGLRYPILRPK